MNPGVLRHRITILKPLTAKDEYGEPVENWPEFASRWASKEHKASRAFYAASKINTEMTDLFSIRFTKGIENHMRVSFDGDVYDIIGAYDPDGTCRETHLLCKLVE